MNLELELKTIIRRLRPGIVGATRNPTRNLRQVIEEFKRKPKYVEQLRLMLEQMVLSRDFVPALTEAGLTENSGVFHEIYKRLEYKILPKPIEGNDVLGLVQTLFDRSGDDDWFEALEEDPLRDFMRQLMPTREKLTEKVVPQLFYSLEILALRLASLGLDPLVKSRLRERTDFQHVFVEVPRELQKFLENKASSEQLLHQLHVCDQAVGWIRSRRDKEGISLGLTFRLMRIQELTKRMRLILKITNDLFEGIDSNSDLELFRQIVLAEIKNFDLREFFGRNVELLAFQMTEHTSRTGEHYVTSTRSEYFHMFSSAAIGGVIVAMLAIIKTFAAFLHLPPFFEALVYGLIYGVGFVVIHHMGGTLATKQPAMTAAYLAAALDSAKNSLEALQNLCEVIVRTIRSQLVALMGNFLIAFPTAALICYPLVYAGYPLMSHDKATHTLEAIHPGMSLSFLYAAIAGVCLFVSGLLAGFTGNWFHFNKVGERLKRSPFLSWLLKGGNFDNAIKSIENNIGFWVGNMALGFFLGSMPPLGVILGLPIDVRHVTFVSATFGAAVSSLNFQVATNMLIWIAIGNLTYGLINLAVSFSLSLMVAIRSRRIRFSQTRQLMKLLLHRLLQRPFDFFWPPRS